MRRDVLVPVLVRGPEPVAEPSADPEHLCGEFEEIPEQVRGAVRDPRRMIVFRVHRLEALGLVFFQADFFDGLPDAVRRIADDRVQELRPPEAPVLGEVDVQLPDHSVHGNAVLLEVVVEDRSLLVALPVAAQNTRIDVGPDHAGAKVSAGNEQASSSDEWIVHEASALHERLVCNEEAEIGGHGGRADVGAFLEGVFFGEAGARPKSDLQRENRSVPPRKSHPGVVSLGLSSAALIRERSLLDICERALRILHDDFSLEMQSAVKSLDDLKLFFLRNLSPEGDAVDAKRRFFASVICLRFFCLFVCLFVSLFVSNLLKDILVGLRITYERFFYRL